MGRTLLYAGFGLVLASGQALAAELVIPLNAIDANGIGAGIGTIRVKDGKAGMMVMPNLSGLTPGPHGFHIHENPSCQPKEQEGKMVPGLSAGGHYDPAKAGKHEGPWGTAIWATCRPWRSTAMGGPPTRWWRPC